MKPLSPAELMINALLGLDKGLSIKHLNHGYLCTYNSPIGNIYIQFNDQPLTTAEHGLLGLILSKATLYDENSNVYSVYRKHALRIFNELLPDSPHILNSRLKGIVAQFNFEDITHVTDTTTDSINNQWPEETMSKFMSMGLEITRKGKSNKITLGFSPIEKFSFVDKIYLVHVSDTFALWMKEATSWEEIGRRFDEDGWSSITK